MSWFSRRPVDDEIDEELRSHLQLRADDLVREGLDPATAERQARIEFGGQLKYREQSREAAATALLDALRQDLRFGLRMLKRSPGFTATAVLTLALGIGANTAVFGILNAVLIRPPAFDRPEQLVKIWGEFPKQGIPQNWISEPEVWDLRDAVTALSAVAAYSTGTGANLSRRGAEPLRVTTSQASAELLPMLGVKPLVGRTFTPEEDQPGRQRVAVLDYRFWRSQTAGDPAVVGREIQLNDETFTVVGVLPEGFSFGGETDMWVPLALDRAKPNTRGSHNLEVLARLAPGASLARASDDVRRAAQRMAAAFPQFYPKDSGFSLYVRPLQADIVGHTKVGLVVIFAAVGLVLLIACLNLANLLLARGSSRNREFAVRAALGADRLRIARQVVAESVVIAIIGGTCGVLLAWWTTDLLKNTAAVALPLTRPIAIDRSVLLFAAMVSLLTAIVFGIVPALRASNATACDALREGTRASSSSGQRLRNGLVVAELALAVVLLVAAGLTARSLERLLSVDPGFRPERLLTARISLPAAQYRERSAAAAFFTNVEQQVRTLPGVQAAGLTSLLPMTGRNSSGSTFVDQTSLRGLAQGTLVQKPYIETDLRIVTDGFFEAMHIPLLRGRLLTSDDTADTAPVILVDEEFAKRIWPDRDPIGQRLAVNGIPNATPPVLQWRTVVGVVGHVKNNSLDQLGREQTYVAVVQFPFPIRNMYLTVRTTGEPTAIAPAVQHVVSRLDSTLPVYETKAMAQWLDSTVSLRRMNMTLLVAFGAVSLLLAALGTYGVISFAVNQRTKEIGIRLSLGATPGHVRRMVVGAGVRLAIAGAGIGAVLAVVAGRSMSSLLFGVQPTDPVTLGVVTGVLIATAAFAAWIPARRATRFDPMTALRTE
jgi:putative ABC transport system permease protein